MKSFSVFVLVCISSVAAHSQSPSKPKLVVGIVVDQMRQEYVHRFDSKFGKGGFKRLTDEGFMLRNAHYNYVPTETGPGHASIYTGTTPAIHGIIANEWYDKDLKKEVNCVNDDKQKTIGSDSRNGEVSPWRNLASTITDELKFATQRRAKVISVSIKDRGAALPGGHMADGAYWYDLLTGDFITSTYYKAALPLWVDEFNKLKLADQYLNQEWKTLLPLDQYKESGIDDSPYETRLKGKEKATFPYNLKELRKTNKDFELLTRTPFGNNILADFAKAAIDAESLGKDEITDFLAVSFSSTDKIGHDMGANSIEVEDTYIRLDKTLEDFFNTLDLKVGKGNYTVFLTADHAVAEIPQYLKDQKMPGGYFKPFEVEANLNEFLQKYFPGKKIVERVSSEQVYLNQDVFNEDPKTSGIDLLIATELISKYLLTVEGVAQVFPESLIRQSAFDEQSIKGKVVRGYHVKRCGDIAFVLEPGWVSWSVTWRGTTGASHGSVYAYDTHVPVIFYGWGIKKGSSVDFHTITDIAPTLSVLLGIKFPSGCTGQPIPELFNK
jgi:predicted AlkP superfamily pyrophosphatase or phosphodiesterase